MISLLHPWRITLRLECSWISGHPVEWIETWKPRCHHPSLSPCFNVQLWTWENWAPSSSSNVAVSDLRMESFAISEGVMNNETKESSKTNTSTHHVRNMWCVVYVYSCDLSMWIFMKYSIFFLFNGHRVTELILSAKALAMTGVASWQNQRRQWSLITWCRMAIHTKLESAKLPSSILLEWIRGILPHPGNTRIQMKMYSHPSTDGLGFGRCSCLRLKVKNCLEKYPSISYTRYLSSQPSVWRLRTWLFCHLHNWWLLRTDRPAREKFETATPCLAEALWTFRNVSSK